MRRVALFVLIGLLGVACGNRGEIYEVLPEPQSAGAISLPEPVPATPAFVARLTRPASPGRLARVRALSGVAVASPLALRRMRVSGPAGERSLLVGAVDPLEFRSVTPPPTRDAEFVWTSLLAGEAVVTFDAADKLDLGREGSIRLTGLGDTSVGAFADNGVPNVADVLVALPLGEDARLEVPTAIAVGAASGTTLELLETELEKLLPTARLTRLGPSPRGPAARAAPEPVAQTSGGLIGTLRYTILDDGFIRPDPSWVAANVATGTVPILGTVTCHRLMFPQLRAALSEIEQRGLAGLIRRGDYGGCYVPRFIDRNPRKPLSMHAFGLAIDFNVSTNQLGTRGDMDPRIVQIFERWGFGWGGRWARPDPMHFELARLLQP